MGNLKKSYIYSALIVAFVTLLIFSLSYKNMPDEVPIHWNIHGEVDKYSSKSSFFILGMVPLFIVGLLSWLPKFDPRVKAYRRHAKAYSVFIFYFTVFFSLIALSILALIFGYALNIPFVVNVLVGLLFIVLGNYAGQIRQNYFFGIRTPWAIHSENNWRKTHRVGRWLLVIVGLLFLICAFLPYEWIIWVPLGCLLVGVLLIYIYSYQLYKKESR